MMRAGVVKFCWSLVLVAVVTGTAVSAEANTTYQDNPYKVAGTVDAVGEPIPAMGATGSFRLTGLYNYAGASIEDAKDANGRVTIYSTAKTAFLKQNAGGSYATSTFEQVVVPGQDVLVAGRWYVIDGRKTLFANYVWNPPPVVLGTRPPNPQPTMPRDLVVQRLFGVTALVTEQGATLVGSTAWSPIWGFTVGDITAYSSVHVQKIAQHHDNKLRIYHGANTRYWTADGRTTLDRGQVVKAQRVVRVTGRYSWDGFDWRFIATNVFADPSPSVGGPLSTTAGVAQQSPGTKDASSETWTGSVYQGRSTYDFDGSSQANITMTLDWFYAAGSDVWDFVGTYTAQKDSSATSISGSIDGTVIRADGVLRAEATMSVDTGTGAWAGWTGDGTFSGLAQTLAPPAPNQPPINLVGSFSWRIFRP